METPSFDSAQDVPLLQTKLYIPPVRPDPSTGLRARLVSRPCLIERLDEGLRSGKLTLVSAPPGFGKTTCISEWVNVLDCPVTWLSLDPADDDPPQSLHLVLLTREAPPLSLARLRANNQLTEFWVEGNFHRDIPLGMFLLQDIALAIVTTWLYNSTEGSLLIVHLFHAASNTTLGVPPILPMDTGGQLRPLWIAVALLWVVAAGIVVVNGPVRLSRRKAMGE